MGTGFLWPARVCDYAMQKNKAVNIEGRVVAGKDYQIAALWMYGSLSYLEQLCLKSFVDAGHHVKLYHYGELFNVPDGIELADANEVLPQTDFLAHKRTGSPALHSDLFRYKMLEQSRDTIWADTDAYCMKRFETPNGHFYGWESDKHINGGVLGLPHDCDTLGNYWSSHQMNLLSRHGTAMTIPASWKRRGMRAIRCMQASSPGGFGGRIR